MVYDEDSQRVYEEQEEIATKYFRAKWDFYIAQKMDMISLTNRQLYNQRLFAADKDDMIKRRAEFMYSFMDYDSDRIRVRDRFLKEM